MLIRSHLAYCSQVWWSHLLCNSRRLESLQHRATKSSVSQDLDYKSRLISVKLLPVSLWLEAQDIIFQVQLMVDPPSDFCLEEYILYISSSTRASSLHRIQWTHPLTPCSKVTKLSCFNRVVRVWNSLPPVDTDHPFSIYQWACPI